MDSSVIYSQQDGLTFKQSDTYASAEGAIYAGAVAKVRVLLAK